LTKRNGPLALGSKAKDEKGTGEKEDGGSGEGGLDVEGAPEESDQEAGKKIADGVDGGERAEGHSVLLLGDNLGGEGIFEGFFGADVETGKNENHRKQRKRIRSGAKENRRDASEAVAGSEHRFAMRDMIAEPAARVSGSGVKDVMKSVKADSEAGGAGEAASGRQRAGGVENQKRVGEISGAEDAYADKQTPE